MKLSDINNDNKKKWLKITDIENIFDIFIDNKNNLMYNLNQTLYLNIPDTYLAEYICTSNMHWPLISYKLYGTTRLAWLLMKINNVDTKNVFVKKNSGDIIIYLPLDYVKNIITEINS